MRGLKTGRSRSRRDRARKKREISAEAQQQRDAGSAPAAGAAAPEEEAFKPLTAAVFYAPREQEKPKPAKGKKAAGKGRNSRAGDNGGSHADASDSAHKEEKKVPALDRSEEAEIPMHWLDEI